MTKFVKFVIGRTVSAVNLDFVLQARPSREGVDLFFEDGGFITVAGTWDEVLALLQGPASAPASAPDRGVPCLCPLCKGEGSPWGHINLAQRPCNLCQGARVLWSREEAP